MRYQKESRLAARGQGKKSLDKLPKVCYTKGTEKRELLTLAVAVDGALRHSARCIWQNVLKPFIPQHSNSCRNGQRKLSSYQPLRTVVP